MKKSLIALAVLGALSGAASAQSSVTLYGIFDIGVQWVEQGVATGNTASPYRQESGTADRRRLPVGQPFRPARL